jgi:hypothetical protein
MSHKGIEAVRKIVSEAEEVLPKPSYLSFDGYQMDDHGLFQTVNAMACSWPVWVALSAGGIKKLVLPYAQSCLDALTHREQSCCAEHAETRRTAPDRTEYCPLLAFGEISFSAAVAAEVSAVYCDLSALEVLNKRHHRRQTRNSITRSVVRPRASRMKT